MNKLFKTENKFYKTTNSYRIARLLARYELYKKVQKTKGDIVECGVFKGNSLLQFAYFNQIFKTKKKLVAFDTFKFNPGTNYKPDKKRIAKFIKQAGKKSITKNKLEKLLKKKGIQNFELIQGNIQQTAPKYIKNNPKTKISLLHIDVDTLEATETILEYLAPKVTKNGIIIFDNYKVFKGETKVANEFIEKTGQVVSRLKWVKVPAFIHKK